MRNRDCENCGCRVYDGYCENCNEETFIARQNAENDEPIQFSKEFVEKLASNDRDARSRLAARLQC